MSKLFDDSRIPDPGRRAAVATLVGAVVTNLLPSEVTAAGALQANFRDCVKAFNNWRTDKNPGGYTIDNTPLKQLLAPDNISIYDVNNDSGWFNGNRFLAVYALSNLAGAQFVVLDSKVHGQAVTGHARWTDIDGTRPDTLTFHFEFDKNNLLFYMAARDIAPSQRPKVG